MLPDRVLNPGPLTYESGALPIALRRPAKMVVMNVSVTIIKTTYRGHSAEMRNPTALRWAKTP